MLYLLIMFNIKNLFKVKVGVDVRICRVYLLYKWWKQQLKSGKNIQTNNREKKHNTYTAGLLKKNSKYKIKFKLNRRYEE